MPARSSSEYTGRIVVRFGRKVVDRIVDRARKPEPDLCSLEEVAEAAQVTDLRGILRKYPGVRSHPAVRQSAVAEILERESRDSDVPLPSLTSYFVADPRELEDARYADRLLADLNAAADVEVAYRERAVCTPQDLEDDPLVNDQGYLDPAPKGIGAKEVWRFSNGAGVPFVDLEAGWYLKHVDLPRARLEPQPMINLNDDTEANHGTAVLGVVLAQRNERGIIGIAHGADFLGVVSHVVDLAREASGAPDAIAKAVEALTRDKGRGGVLLLEAQTVDGYPIEVDEVTFTAIRRATRAGIIVIEASGNGTGRVGRDLDRATRWDGRLGSPRDSGAIIASGCHANLAGLGGHRRVAYTGYGSRVDCYAWGENVVTTGGGDFGPEAQRPSRKFTAMFGGSSSAAAIIAGAAILVQQMAGAYGKGPLEAPEMRRLLSDPTTGTPVLAPTGTQRVGVMPDLKKIARKLGCPVGPEPASFAVSR
jgi:hypothetical protein